MSNSAQELHDLLDKARAHDSNVTLRQVWSSVFSLSLSDTDQLYGSIGELVELIVKTEREIKAISGVDSKLYLRPFQKIHKLTKMLDLDQPWAAGKELLDDVTMYGLQLSADTLSITSTVTLHVRKNDINQIRDDCESLLQDLHLPDITQPFKQYISDRLSELYVSVTKYRTTGLMKVAAVLVSKMDSLEREKNFLLGELKHSANKPVFTKYIKTLTEVYALVNFEGSLGDNPLIAELTAFEN